MEPPLNPGTSSIVLADDSTTIQKVVQLSFADEQIGVRIFSDGKSALQDILVHGADAVLVDISLPEMDGYELCRTLRENAAMKHVPVILLAGTFEPFDVERAEKVGYTGSLTKPFETSQLVSLVKELLQKEDSSRRTQFSRETGERESLPNPESFPIVPTLSQAGGDLIFELSPEECRPTFQLLEREVIGSIVKQKSDSSEEPASQEESVQQSGELTPEQLDQLVNRLSERLPDTLRSLLPRVLEENLRKKD